MSATIVRLIEEKERGLVASLVNKMMRERYHCDAYELPEYVLVANRDKDICGVMALSIGGDKPFPLEVIYDLNYNRFPGPFCRQEIVQLGRWIVTVPGIAETLFHASTLYALRRKCIWGIGEIKP